MVSAALDSPGRKQLKPGKQRSVSPWESVTGGHVLFVGLGVHRYYLWPSEFTTIICGRWSSPGNLESQDFSTALCLGNTLKDSPNKHGREYFLPRSEKSASSPK